MMQGFYKTRSGNVVAGVFVCAVLAVMVRYPERPAARPERPPDRSGGLKSEQTVTNPN
jgi:hypothetical protein